MADRFIWVTKGSDGKAFVSTRAIAYVVGRDDQVGGSLVFFSGMEDDYITVDETLPEIAAMIIRSRLQE